MSLFSQTWRRVTSEWKALIEQPVLYANLSASMHQVSVPYFGFYFMLALASLLLTFGPAWIKK